MKNEADVRLRGIHISGKQADLPNLIFFPDVFDSAENWIPFFADTRSKVAQSEPDS